MTYSEERTTLILAVLAAVLVAAHAPLGPSLSDVVGAYAYWLGRIAVECLLFLAVRAALETYVRGLGFWTLTILAAAVSHLPFVLSVTAFDIALGEPELVDGGGVGETHFIALLIELFYLADNHAALCLLLSVPRWLISEGPLRGLEEGEAGAGPTMLGAIDPPLDGAILWVEAQEHYVRITTTAESRMVLARFSDVIRELADKPGLQVHRSHWVLTAAVAAKLKDGQSLKLLLNTGDEVPVSRSFRQQVLAEISV